MKHGTSSRSLNFIIPFYSTFLFCVLGLHHVQQATATALGENPKHFRSNSTRRVVPPSPLPCKLKLDDPLCPFEDTFKKFDKNFWIRSNDFAWSDSTTYPCWFSKANTKKIKKKKAPEGVLKLTIKKKPNSFNGALRPFSCAEIYSRKSFGFGCYESEMKPSLIFG